MEMVLSSNASIMDSTLSPSEKYFIQGSHLACEDTRQLSAVDGTRLRGKLKKKGWCGGQAFPSSGSEKTVWLRSLTRAKGPHQVNFKCSTSVLIFKLVFSEATSFADPLYHRFAAEDSLVGHEDLGPFCRKYNISL